MADERTIPLLPCKSLDETLDFYRTVGFEVLHEQTDPYTYGAIRRDAIELHFHGLKRLDPEKSASTCLVFVDDVGPYHRTFSDALRSRLGKVPTSGFPRITRLKKGQYRFSTFDPSGNKLLYITRNEPEMDYSWYLQKKTKLSAAIDNACFLRDTYTNDKAAAQVLDKALAADKSSDPIECARALATRAELAVAMGDAEAATAARAKLQQVALSDEDRERLRDEPEAADALERWIG